MQALEIRDDVLIDIASFLVKRWSERNDISIEFSDSLQSEIRLKEKKVMLASFQKFQGNEFQKYRQFRINSWYEAMRLKYCKKILSNDHAFGFILNTIETRRIELSGRKIWKGMDHEMIFNYAYMWIYRTNLNSIFGKSRIIEAFYQYFLFGDVKGELASNQMNKVATATNYAKQVVKYAIYKGYGTEYIESKVPDIIKLLDIDALITIPAHVPLKGPGFMVNPFDVDKALKKISKNREDDFGEIESKDVLDGKQIQEEFKVVKEENKKNENKGMVPDAIGIQIPEATSTDETRIYDQELISNLKTRFREWRMGWKETHVKAGEEFDEESYIEGFDRPFITDLRKTVKSRIVILLDHSSSISDQQTEYKKATVALCEVLSFLKIKFSVYAFNTVEKQVVCWLVKSEDMKWNYSAAKRLVNISANGGTPLAEVYERIFPVIRTKKPDIFLTFSDGEPSDPDAVRAMLKSFRTIGIKMVAIGVGRNAIGATTIAMNLKYLGYERTLAVSRLKDIPNKVLSVLGVS